MASWRGIRPSEGCAGCAGSSWVGSEGSSSPTRLSAAQLVIPALARHRAESSRADAPGPASELLRMRMLCKAHIAVLDLNVLGPGIVGRLSHQQCKVTMYGFSLDHQRLPGLEVQTQADQELGILFKRCVLICHRDALSAPALIRPRNFLVIVSINPARRRVVPQKIGSGYAHNCDLPEAARELDKPRTRPNRMSSG